MLDPLLKIPARAYWGPQSLYLHKHKLVTYPTINMNNHIDHTCLEHHLKASASNRQRVKQGYVNCTLVKNQDAIFPRRCTGIAEVNPSISQEIRMVNPFNLAKLDDSVNESPTKKIGKNWGTLKPSWAFVKTNSFLWKKKYSIQIFPEIVLSLYLIENDN